jgi:hypothetical protein
MTIKIRILWYVTTCSLTDINNSEEDVASVFRIKDKPRWKTGHPYRKRMGNTVEGSDGSV